MISVWRAALEEFQHGRDFVFASILDVRGSSPRHVGTRFLVRRNGSIVGTIGGGLFEAEVQRFAVSALESGTSHRAVFSFTGKDSHSSEMICGGEVEVLIEFVPAADKTHRGDNRTSADAEHKPDAGIFIHLYLYAEWRSNYRPGRASPG